jgi:dynamin 1-like protein
MPANQDLSVSDALQMARQVDPQGLRTIGVITKIDIMDRGTDAVRMLKGEDIPLRLGYVGLKLRSQADIQEGKNVKKAVQEEKEWFEEHAKYSKLPPGLTGTTVLIDKLTLVLCHHIRQFLPQIKREVSERVRKVEERLEELGNGVPEGAADRVQMMWTMISAYADMFTNTIRGKYDKRLTLFMQETKETQSGGAKVRAVFNDFLSTYANEKGVGSLMTDDEIDTAIKMHEGDSLPGFPSPDTFEFLVLPHLKKIQEPAIECLTEVSQILENLCQKIAKVVFRRFPRLGEVVLEMTKSILAREQAQTQVVVENIVQYETGYLFTNDVGYLNNHGTMSNMSDRCAALLRKFTGARACAPILIS